MFNSSTNAYEIYNEDIFTKKAFNILMDKGLNYDSFRNETLAVGNMYLVPEYTRGVSLRGSEGGKILRISRLTEKSIWWEELKWEKVGEYTWANTYCYDIIQYSNDDWINGWTKKYNDYKFKKFTERISTFKKRYGCLINEDIKNEIIQHKYKRMSCDLGF